ncbi:RNA polymerase sigma-70 factor, ECF subfamily [Chitinophaga niabensis]|uniref:RNA polymerase sigma-70 factor, ECF subfamily n=2 Tax=Chitinophaga niabensis TaxID=536979 RepID=A0A1N6DUY7_9BACT|nr:RNA polymerase sigma-70 factor, ECF subfamily [Chitinophaga niabensis]
MEETAFLQQIDQHQGIIHKICRLYRDSPEDREDLFQEIVFQLWKTKHTFQGKAKFSSWMYRVALSTAMATFRKKKPAIIYTPELPDIPQTEDEDQQRQQLLAALKQLDDADKALMALYLDDLSYEEIAEIAGISENYVGVKLTRIRNRIIKILGTWTH